jgi:signal peptidase
VTTSHVEIGRTTAGSGALPAPGAVGRATSALRRAAGGCVVVALAAAAAFVLVLCVGPRLLPYRAYAIDSGSMAPTLPVGSEAILRPVQAERLRVGDVITFKRPDNKRELVTHRIVRIERKGGVRLLVTKGDANALPDAWRVRASGTGWRYAFRIPYAGYLVQGLTLPIARLALLALIGLLLGAAAIRRIWSPSTDRR